MPVPGGEITTTEIWQAPVEEPVEDYAASLEPDFLTKELVEDSITEEEETDGKVEE
jgi:hypothetical protein